MARLRRLVSLYRLLLLIAVVLAGISIAIPTLSAPSASGVASIARNIRDNPTTALSKRAGTESQGTSLALSGSSESQPQAGSSQAQTESPKAQDGSSQTQAGRPDGQTGPAEILPRPFEPQLQDDLSTVQPALEVEVIRLANLGFSMFDQIMFATTVEQVTNTIQQANIEDLRNPVSIEYHWQRDVAGVSTSLGTSSSHDWSKHTDEEATCNIASTMPAIRSIHLAKKYSANSFTPFTCFVWKQDKTFHPDNPLEFRKWAVRNDQTVLPSHAEMRFAYSVGSNTIVVLRADSVHALMQQRQNSGTLPTWVESKRDPVSGKAGELPVPRLQSLPDMIAYTIKELSVTTSSTSTQPHGGSKRRTRSQIAALDTIVFQSPRLSPETLGVVKYILSRMPPYYQLGAWPGTRFIVGEPGFDALIATTEFQAIAWFCAQRKKTFGKVARAAWSVHIFRGVDDSAGTPSFLWQITNVGPGELKGLRDRHLQNMGPYSDQVPPEGSMAPASDIQRPESSEPIDPHFDHPSPSSHSERQTPGGSSNSPSKTGAGQWGRLEPDRPTRLGPMGVGVLSGASGPDAMDTTDQSGQQQQAEELLSRPRVTPSAIEPVEYRAGSKRPAAEQLYPGDRQDEPQARASRVQEVPQGDHGMAGVERDTSP